MQDKKERLFIGVPLSQAALEVSLAAQEALPEMPGLRLIAGANLHVTLAFIGPADARKKQSAWEAVERIPEHLGGWAELGGFLFLPSPRRPRVVGLSISDESQVFLRLFEQVMGDLEQAGVMTREKRPFLPHLTIARLRSPEPVQPKYECPGTRFPVGSVCLYRSDLRREGAMYTALLTRRLKVDNGVQA